MLKTQHAFIAISMFTIKQFHEWSGAVIIVISAMRDNGIYRKHYVNRPGSLSLLTHCMHAFAYSYNQRKQHSYNVYGYY